ncbi:hypothetical protein LPJ56_001320, partial [Coemansia sp. RSA 2599]
VRSASINGHKCEYRRSVPEDRRSLLGRVVSQKQEDDGERRNLEITIPSEIQIEAISDDSEVPLDSSALPIEPTYKSLRLRIEFYLVDPAAGLVFTTTADNLLTVHTETQLYPSTTRLWVPCLDEIHERCTWDFFYIVPACIGTFESGVLPVTVVSSGELSSLVVHPRDPAKRVFRYIMSTATPPCMLGFAIGPFTSAYTLDGSLLANGADASSVLKDPNSAVESGLKANGEESDRTKDGGGNEAGRLKDKSKDEDGDEGGDGDKDLGDGNKPQRLQHDSSLAAELEKDKGGHRGAGDDDSQDSDADDDAQRVPSSSGAAASTEDQTPVTEAKTSHNSKLRKATIDAIGGVFAFAFPGMQSELENTCSFIPEALAFYSQEFGSYPYTTYKVVFMEGLRAPLVTCASLTLLSTDFLHPRTVIEQVYETRRCLGMAIAQQWFGTYVVAESWSDYWLVAGLAGYVSGLFVRHNLGHNEYRYRLKRDMLRVCHADVNQRPISYPDQGPIIRSDVLEFVALKAAVVIHMLDRRMMKGGMSLGLHRIVPKILVAAMSGDLGASNAVGTTWFLKMCRKVSGVDLKSFADQWIYGTGCPVFHFSYAFNRKKLAVEITMHQESTNSKATAPWARPQLFSGQMTARIREADGTPYEHVLDIHEGWKRFEVQFNTKYKRIRRSTKRFHKRQIEAAEAELSVNVEVLGIGDDDEAYSNIALFGAEDEDEKREWRVVEWGEDDEESLASATFEWIRMDPDLEWASIIHFEQPDFMWAAQLQKDRDVAAQLEAVDALQHLPSSAASTTLMRTVMDGRVFYRVRVDAALALSRFAKEGLDWIGLHHLLKIYANRYCIENEAKELLPKPNNFANVGEYFTQKAVLAALSNVRDRYGEAPSQARSLMLTALRYNDNSENVYTDSYFLASLVRAVASATGDSKRFSRKFSVCVEPRGEDALLNEIERLRKLDMLVPSFHNVITGACLDSLLRLSLVHPEEPLFNTALFFSMASSDAYIGVRETAVGGLLLHWGMGESNIFNRFFTALSSDTSAPRLAATASRYVMEALMLRSMAFGRQHNSLLFQKESGKEATEHIDTDARLVGGLESFIDYIGDSPELQMLLAASLYDSSLPLCARGLLAAVHALVYQTVDCSLPPPPPATRKKLKIKLGSRLRKPQSNASSDSEDMPLALSVERPQHVAENYSIEYNVPATRDTSDLSLSGSVAGHGSRKWQRTPSLSEASTSGLPQIAGTRPPPITVPDTRMHSPAYAGPAGSSAAASGASSIVASSVAGAVAQQGSGSTEPVKVKLKLKFSKPSSVAAASGSSTPLPISTSTAQSASSTQISNTSVNYHSTVPRVSSPLATSHVTSPSRGGRTTPSAWSPAMQRILRKVCKHPSAFPFSRPVDVNLDGCPTYYDVIKNPMDLSTIKQKLDSRKYTDPADFAADMRLMFDNCYTFNPPGTLVYDMGKELEAAFDREWKASALLSEASKTPPRPASSAKKSSGGLKLKISKTSSSQIMMNDPDAIMEYLDSTDPAAVSAGKPRQSTPVPSGGNWKTMCNRVLLHVQAQPSALEFMAPVDPIKQGVPTYFDIIKHPMDLGTIRKKLDRSQYQSPKQFVDDVNLVFSNCFLFNPPGTYVHSQGQALQHVFETVWHQQTGARPEENIPQSLPEDIPIVDKALERARTMLSKIKKDDNSWPFLKPVDPVAFGVPTYFDIVKNPMDISTLQDVIAGLLQADG